MGIGDWWHIATVAALCLALIEGVLILGLARAVAPRMGPPPRDVVGVDVGTAVPSIMLSRVGTGAPEPISGHGVDRVVIFVRPSCSGCTELVPVLEPAVELQNGRWEVVVVVCGERERAESYAAALIKRQVRTLLDPDSIGEAAFATQQSYPFGFAVGGDGIVRARTFATTWGLVRKLAIEGALWSAHPVTPVMANGTVAQQPAATRN